MPRRFNRFDQMLDTGLIARSRLLLVAPTMSGDIIAQELGIRMAQEVDPTTRMPTTAMGRLFESTFLLLFLGLNGHHDVIRSLHASYSSFPVAATRLPGTLPELVTGLQLCVRHAILIAAPLMGILLIFSVVLALLAKSVPQVNLMNFGVSLRMLGGFIAAVLVFPLLQRPLLDLLGSLRGALDSVAGG